MPEARATGALEHGVPTIAASTTTTLANRTGSWKNIQPIYQDKIAPCNASCPVGIDLEGVMNLLRQDRIEEARELLLRENPLPATSGRVCERPCEGACSRAQFDGAVSIHAVERMLGDLPHDEWPAPPPRSRHEHVAVIGAGPAGLACAYHLARLGYSVRVFEAEAEAGGWLRYGAARELLPREVLAREIERIHAAGVTFRFGVRVGTDLAWSELAQFDAVFIACGAHASESFAWGRHPLPHATPHAPGRSGSVVRADAFGHTGRSGTFVGGDLLDEPATVAHALGSGKRAAIGIDRWLRQHAGEETPAFDEAALRYGATGNMSITRWRGDDPVHRTNELNEVVTFDHLNTAYFTHEPTRPDRLRAPGDAGPNLGESNLGLTHDDAMAEAKRCFNCGVCNDCELCMVLCPDVAIKPHGSGHGFSLSYKYCKGCGICAAECPRGAMTMTREGL